MIALQDRNLESLLKEAKEHEKKYEWLQAAEYYNKACDLSVDKKNILKAAEIQEKTAYCYFRAALQAQLPEQNKKGINQAIRAYEETVGLIEQIETRNKQSRINHNKGWILFLKAWLEIDLSKKKELLDKWWKLESSYFKIYDELADPPFTGKIYNDLLELSAVDRFFVVTDNSELKEISKQGIILGEKSIKLLSKENNIYELARTYCWTSWYYGFGILYGLIDENKKEEYSKKGVYYAKKAIELSEKIGNAWLIGWSNNSASLSSAAQKFNLKLALKHADAFIKQGRIAKDNWMLAVALGWNGLRLEDQLNTIEDPEKLRESIKEVLKYHEESKKFADLSTSHVMRIISRNKVTINLERLSLYETNPEVRKTILKKIILRAKETLHITPQWHQYSALTFHSLSITLFRLSEILTNIKEKKRNLLDALKYQKKANELIERFTPANYSHRAFGFREMAKIQLALVRIEENDEKKNSLFEDTVSSVETCLNLLEKGLGDSSEEWILVRNGNFQYESGRILYQLYLLTKKEDLLTKTNELFDKAIKNYNESKHYSSSAEAYWQKAQIKDQLGEQLKSSKNYQLAFNAYLKASEKLPKLKEFYINYSTYMQAWSEIELAQYNHSRENYLQAKINYEKAAELHQKLYDWNYLSPNYFAWAKLEQAEESSRNESPQEAINNFQEAIQYFKKTESNIKTKINENPIAEDKDLMTRILKASEIRQKYCQARIEMEEAKLLDREGKFLDSSKKYGGASHKISAIVDKIDNDVEGKELEYLAILCRAWEKMAIAEEATSAESYLEAAELFEHAKDYCFTRKASLWALGNSNFCKGLASGLQYKSSLDLADHAKAKGYIKTASTDYLQAGFKQASEYAKATQRLFDAYLSMNQAEMEADQEKRAKHYQMAENLLQVAAGSFVKAKQPEKHAQIQEILSNVKEEKALAVSLSQVMQAPSIASSTLSFSAPSPTSESSIGLEKFEHANVQANLVTHVKQVKVGESFCLSVEFVNAGREPALLMQVDDFVPSDFVVVKKPEIYRIEESCLNMKGKQLAPLKLVEVKLTLQPAKKGNYQLNPKVHYLDELGQNKSLQLKTVEIKVEEVIIEDRISTGTQELDSLLLGGIPKDYAVVLSGSPCDERELMTKNFLETGTEEGITFCITTEAVGLEELLQKPNFYLFLCNPKPKTPVADLPNVYRLQGKADITNLGIALTKAMRNIEQSATKKRICVEILSDSLMIHGPKTTREWISGLITDFVAKGFTILAVIDPTMHSSEQANAVINLFDGEISIIQSDDPLDCKKSIHVKKLRNQDYIKNPICLR